MRHPGTSIRARSAPGIAPTILAVDAVDADKVDGKHAVRFGATVDSRKGKLVAINASTGKLPNNIMAKAPDADAVDGHHANELTRVAVMGTADTLDLTTGEQTYGTPLTITAPKDGFVNASGGSASLDPDGTEMILIGVPVPNGPRRRCRFVSCGRLPVCLSARTALT